MVLQSEAFPNGGRIPMRYTADGEDISPPLSWSGVPSATKSFALIVDDPDAPAGTWVHWVAWNIPSELRALPEAIKPVANIPGLLVQGKNDFQRLGYGGPSPPRGSHRYFFSLYALDTVLGLMPGANKQQLLAAMRGHILAEAKFFGLYSR